ncbi:hypothetical protein KP509_02G096900 [Ceratopteris richardii]|uniref:Uncharacterized protein n=1 Tax=Ceratopteris richardii TaxID=49495 RepID=A0A8T2V8X0_CERRI|nr:hypothetical protein KP509_02G096900 [Ceratopteris richardii]
METPTINLEHRSLHLCVYQLSLDPSIRSSLPLYNTLRAQLSLRLHMPPCALLYTTCIFNFHSSAALASPTLAPNLHGPLFLYRPCLISSSISNSLYVELCHAKCVELLEKTGFHTGFRKELPFLLHIPTGIQAISMHTLSNPSHSHGATKSLSSTSKQMQYWDCSLHLASRSDTGSDATSIGTIKSRPL